jgi:hypothetical protein
MAESDPPFGGAASRGTPLIDPVRVCCGQRHTTIACPDGKVMCQLCFSRVEVDGLAIDGDGNRVDVCLPCFVHEQTMLITTLNHEGRPRVAHIANDPSVTLCGVPITWDTDHMARPDAPDCPVCKELDG